MLRTQRLPIMAERGEPIRIGVRELRGKLGDYLRQVRAGARFLIVSRGEPVAQLSAPVAESLERKPARPASSRARSGWRTIGMNGPRAS
jgi:prevent-host-death family protein